jgi:acyl-CoA thioesterase YciA
MTKPIDTMLALRVVPLPTSADVHGEVFGGWIMSHVGIAGSISASARRSNVNNG